jgi:hypothetical protein
MARIRTIKPSFWSHEQLSALPCEFHMLAGALLNYADDHGYFNANPALVKAGTMPLREFDVPAALAALFTVGFIRLGEAPDGRRFGHIINFGDHQRVDRAQKSTIATLAITWIEVSIVPARTRARDERTDHGSIQAQSLEEGNGMEGNGREGKESARAGDMNATSAVPVASGAAPMVCAHGAASLPVVATPQESTPPPGPRLNPRRAHSLALPPRDLTAFWEGPIFALPGVWASKAMRNYRMTEDEMTAFGRALTSKVETTTAGIVEDGGKRLQWLDQQLDLWRTARKQARKSSLSIEAGKIFIAQTEEAAGPALDPATAAALLRPRREASRG